MVCKMCTKLGWLLFPLCDTINLFKRKFDEPFLQMDLMEDLSCPLRTLGDKSLSIGAVFLRHHESSQILYRAS